MSPRLRSYGDGAANADDELREYGLGRGEVGRGEGREGEGGGGE